MTPAAIGIEMGPRTVRAVALGTGAPAILSRADGRAANGNLPRAAKAVVQKVLPEGAGRIPARVCAHDPSDVAIMKALGSIRALVDVPDEVVRAGEAAVVAENWMGAATEVHTAVALVIGDQISAGILLNGQLWHGSHGLAGCAAWLALNPVERQDYRRTGCLHAEASSRGVARRFVWRIQAGDQSAVLEKGADLDAITADHVYDGARAHDGVAISVVRETARYIGMAVANLVSTIDPELVVLCGEVGRAGDLLLDPVRLECARRLPPALAARLRVEMSALAEEAPAIGAARLALS
ncbi:MAG TPA: ROK family protein [Vicinamibacterales bacterium]|nr:ROK family protein [Vicinamibacterales bacterium]